MADSGVLSSDNSITGVLFLFLCKPMLYVRPSCNTAPMAVYQMALKTGTNPNPEANPNPTRSTDPNHIAKMFIMIIKIMIRFA